MTIEVGDTVEWIWGNGTHTVTSGTDLSDPEVGALFDDPLNSANPLVTYTFTEIGSQDYFCRPHVGLGMTGTVIVTAPSAVGDTPTAAAVQLMPNVPNPFNPIHDDHLRAAGRSRRRRPMSACGFTTSRDAWCGC